MIISELIAELTDAQDNFGNLEVYTMDYGLRRACDIGEVSVEKQDGCMCVMLYDDPHNPRWTTRTEYKDGVAIDDSR